MKESINDAWAEWRKGWTLVLAAAAGVSLGAIHVYSTGVFMQPLEAEFGWTRAQISAGLTIGSILGFLFSPVFGALVDRLGARRIALPGAALYCIAIASLSLAGPSIWSWLVLWFFVAVTTLGLKPTVWSAAVSSSFTASRGMALAIMLCGTGVASSIVPVLTHRLIEEVGWRGAYQALAGSFALFVLPLLWFFFHDARQPHSSRATRSGAEREAVADPSLMNGWTLREGLRRRQFYQLGLAAALGTLVNVGFIVHLVPLLSDQGLGRDQAVGFASMVGLMSIVGRLSVGFLFDRLHGPPVGAVSILLPALSAVILIVFPGSLGWSVVAVVLLGLAVGGEYDAIIYLSTRYFGMRSFGSLFGFTASCVLAGVGFGPVLTGLAYDVSGSYEIFLWGALPLAVISAISIGTLGPYPDHDRGTADEY
jgi:MFS family permease